MLNIKSPRWLSPHYSPDLVLCNFWLFPKLKSALEAERFQMVPGSQFRKIRQDSWWWLENCVRSQGAYIEGDWGGIVLPTLFLVSWIFLNKCIYFSCCTGGYFLDRPHVCRYIYIFAKEIYTQMTITVFFSFYHVCKRLPRKL